MWNLYFGFVSFSFYHTVTLKYYAAEEHLLDGKEVGCSFVKVAIHAGVSQFFFALFTDLFARKV